MRETSSQGKACAMSVAVAAGVGIAGMGLASNRVAAADITSVTDVISVEVLQSCTFNSTENRTYNGSAKNGEEVKNFEDSGVHEFNLFCNSGNGFVVTATPDDLKAEGIDRAINYTDNYTPSGTNGLWTAVITSDSAGVTTTSPVPVGGGTIISSSSGTEAAGVNFTAAYSAYVGTETPAGTYSGTIIYTLTALSAPDSGNNGSGDNEGDNNGTNPSDSDNSNPGKVDNNGSSGTNDPDSGTGGSDTNGTSQNADSGSNSSSNSPITTATNNSYSTYNTYNMYNTTSYPSGGTGTASTTGIQVATSGNTTGTTTGATSENSSNGNTFGTNSSYEKPLGVTTNTSSSDENSGIDWMPIAVTAGVLAAAGVAAVALARSNKEEDQQQQ